jgi:site-specific DNA recombinase
MKNVVAYCRVSTDAQAGEDRFGIESQKSQIMEYCMANDMQVSGWYVDEGESGAKMNRPEFDRLIYGEVSNPPVEAVVVAKSDRIARDIEIYYYYKMCLRQKGIELASVSEDFGKFGVFAEILESFTLTAAKMERENITKRTSAGRRVKAAQGGYSGGRAPYGYCVKEHALEVVESEAETVRVIFAMRDENATLQAITDALNKDGRVTKAGKRFAVSTVQTIINNRKVYCGMYRYGGGEWVKGQHEAILEVEV